MKVKTAKLNELDVGDAFLYNGDLYVCLQTGQFNFSDKGEYGLEPETKVTPVDIEVTARLRLS
ncbi:MAG: hypothetical protein ACOC4Y_00980 [bacterium]